MRDFDVKAALSEVRGEVRFNEPMARHTTMKVGGPADALVIPRDLEDLGRLVLGAKKEGIPFFVLGGTNLLVKDGGIRGIVIKLNRLNKVRILSRVPALPGEAWGVGVSEDQQLVLPHGPPHIIDSEAGVSFPRLSQKALEASLSGLEFACGIPGTLGGAIVMNAGTRDGEIADVLETVRIMSFDGELQEYSRDRLEFSYRRSRLPEGIIVGALLRLKPAPQSQIRERMEASLAHRRKTQPLHLPNAGCIFKNPAGASAGHLIDALGLKGKRVGDAQVSEKHANFIVNLGAAKATHVLTLVQEIRDQVKQKNGILLDLEIKVVGEDEDR